MGLELLEGALDIPAAGVRGDDRRRLHTRVGGVEVLIAVGTLQGVHEDPADRHEPLAGFVSIADFRGPKFTYNETIVGTGRQG
jgi:hypothetical protein